MLTFDTGVQVIQATSSITERALAQSQILANALSSSAVTGITWQTPFPNTSIGNQLAQMNIRLINVVDFC